MYIAGGGACVKVRRDQRTHARRGRNGLVWTPDSSFIIHNHYFGIEPGCYRLSVCLSVSFLAVKSTRTTSSQVCTSAPNATILCSPAAPSSPTRLHGPPSPRPSERIVSPNTWRASLHSRFCVANVVTVWGMSL